MVRYSSFLLRVLAAILAATIALVTPMRPARAQGAPAPGAFKVADQVDADYRGNGTWIPATVVEVQDGGYSYKLHGDPYGNGKPWDFSLHYKRVRAASAATAASAARASAAATVPASGSIAPQAGKYGCTESIYHPSGFEIETRGFITLRADGSYQYEGMGSSGRYSFDVAKGVTRFTHGYMDSATATAVDGRRDRIFLVPFTRSERKLHWTCTRVR